MSLQDGEDRQFRNQFSDFLQKNTTDDVPIVKKKQTRKRKGKLDNFLD